MSTALNLPLQLDRAYRTGFFGVDDPGASGTISFSNKGHAICEVTTAAAESRALPSAAGYGLGTRLLVVLREDGGNLTITGADASVILTAAGDLAEFVVTLTESGSTVSHVWRRAFSTVLFDDLDTAETNATVILDAQQEDIDDQASAISVATYFTTLTTAGGAGAATVADGTVVGQLKKIQFIVDDGNNFVVTLTSAADENTITFADAGDLALLRWNGTGWRIVELSNDADGATAPAASTV